VAKPVGRTLDSAKQADARTLNVQMQKLMFDLVEG
jgi:hypothetical protein